VLTHFAILLEYPTLSKETMSSHAARSYCSELTRSDIGKMRGKVFIYTHKKRLCTQMDMHHFFSNFDQTCAIGWVGVSDSKEVAYECHLREGNLKCEVTAPKSDERAWCCDEGKHEYSKQ
jgi:hypothetical protein